MATLYVTDKKIPLDENLVKKLDLMIKRCEQEKPKLDNLTNIEGPEGIGKTTMSALCGYYIHFKTGRPFSEENVFVDTKKAIEFAQSTENQIIIFDEPALDILSAEWWKQVQRDLIKLLMLARKKRHFFIFNISKFYKFHDYIVVDRASCMIHLYQRQDSNQPAFAYIGKLFLEPLYNDYKNKKQRNYRRYFLFRGTFPDVLDKTKDYNILDHFNIDNYEKNKDEAILSIGKKAKEDMREFKRTIGRLKFPIANKKEMAKQLGMTYANYISWGRDRD